MWAAKNDKMEVLNSMIATRRVDFNTKDAAGNTPILSALRNRKRKLPSDLQDLYLESIEKRNKELEEKSKTPECPVSINDKSSLISILDIFIFRFVSKTSRRGGESSNV